MENFIVSARKYRPSAFDTVVGQQSITNTLKNAIKNNHLAQAFLFCGPRGVGKTTCARIMAKTINCENLSDSIEACDECTSCKNFSQSASFNVYELDAASNNSVEDIRTLVDQVRIPPQRGRYKVYIIDEVHMLSTAAFNAFLKTLEEPPAYAKFILATTEKHKILPTILSRCQIFDFKRITVEDIAGHLANIAKQEGVDAESDALHIIAQKADGALRDALSIFDQIVSFAGKKIDYQSVIENLNVLDYEYYFKLTEMFLKNDLSNALLLLDDILQKGFDAHHFISGLGEHLRNLLVCKDEATLKLLEVGGNIKEKYKNQSGECPQNFLLKAIDINNKTDIQYRGATNKRLLVELNLMQLCSITHAENPFMKGAKPQPIKAPATAPQSKNKNTSSSAPKHTDQAKAKEQEQEQRNSQKAGNSNLKINYGTTSLKDLAKNENEEKSENEGNEEDTNKAADDFTKEDFLSVWYKFNNNIKDTNPSLHNTFNRREPELRDGKTIVVKLDNNTQNEDPVIKEGQLIRYLRQQLNNFLIDIETQVDTVETNTKPYTDEEKFKKMAENNPSIIKLKNKLDLDFSI